jgi:arginase family enzyme
MRTGAAMLSCCAQLDALHALMADLEALGLVTLDCDGLDPGIMPGVAARTPGGLTYTQVIDLIGGLGRRARITGFDCRALS